MSLRQSPQPAVESKRKKEGSSGKYAFLLSTFFHGGILLLIGGIVLIPAVVQKAAFTSDSSMIVPSETSMEAPPDSSNVQNELPNSEVPQETVTLPDRTDPVAPTDIIIARQDSSMASSSWASSVNSRPVSAKLPSFNQNDNQQQNQHDTTSEKRVALDSTKMTLFGSTDQEDPNGIQGSFYDLKRFKGGIPSGLDLGPESYGALIRQFTDHQWDEKFLKKYWSAKNNVFLHNLLIASMDANEAPKVFDVKCDPKGWVIHYKGYITPAKTGTYRFYGNADDLILVRFNNKIVLDGSIGVGYADPSTLGTRDRSGKLFDFNKIYSPWPEDKKIAERGAHGVAGDWISMSAGTPYPIEILIGERPGGKFGAFILVEQKGQSDSLPGFFSTDSTVRPADIPKGVTHSGKPVYFKVVPAPSQAQPFP